MGLTMGFGINHGINKINKSVFNWCRISHPQYFVYETFEPSILGVEHFDSYQHEDNQVSKAGYEPRQLVIENQPTANLAQLQAFV